mmetsp:Transcript_31170/g.73614  ORF Transcript_31170/g.73614 Transcript_31170/m.73614 type:complete len:298 (+) Transcript_31170:447-1340(+)
MAARVRTAPLVPAQRAGGDRPLPARAQHRARGGRLRRGLRARPTARLPHQGRNARGLPAAARGGVAFDPAAARDRRQHARRCAHRAVRRVPAHDAPLHLVDRHRACHLAQHHAEAARLRARAGAARGRLPLPHRDGAQAHGRGRQATTPAAPRHRACPRRGRRLRAHPHRAARHPRLERRARATQLLGQPLAEPGDGHTRLAGGDAPRADHPAAAALPGGGRHRGLAVVALLPALVRGPAAQAAALAQAARRARAPPRAAATGARAQVDLPCRLQLRARGRGRGHLRRLPSRARHAL